MDRITQEDLVLSHVLVMDPLAQNSLAVPLSIWVLEAQINKTEEED